MALRVVACEREVNRLALSRVVRNLLSNAHSYGGEEVEMELMVVAGAAVIEVRDRGPGIAAERREAMFQPFVRGEPSRNRNTGGVGLGLAIVRDLCEANGWRIGLDERTGGGTVARVELPAEGEEAGRADTSERIVR